MTPPQAPQTHCHPALDIRAIKRDVLVPDNKLQIAIKELEHEIEVLVLGREHVEQADDVLVAQLLQELDLADGVHGDAVLHRRHFDLLDGDGETRGAHVAEVHDGVGSFADFAVWRWGGVSEEEEGLGGEGVEERKEGEEGERGGEVPFSYLRCVSSLRSCARRSSAGRSSMAVMAGVGE